LLGLGYGGALSPLGSKESEPSELCDHSRVRHWLRERRDALLDAALVYVLAQFVPPLSAAALLLSLPWAVGVFAVLLTALLVFRGTNKKNLHCQEFLSGIAPKFAGISCKNLSIAPLASSFAGSTRMSVALERETLLL
jgi:hypothetical protein